MPAGQPEQAVDCEPPSAERYVPAPHEEHWEVPVVDVYEPAAHGAHKETPADAENVPPWQGVHSSDRDAATVVEKVPAAQLVHSVVPLMNAKRPGEQVLQTDAAWTAENIPGWHRTHVASDDAALAGENRPWEHSAHAEPSL